MSEREPVTLIQTPVRLDYTVTAGGHLSRFLRALADGRIVGAACPECAKVYVPWRGVCPTCGVADGTETQVADTGTVTTFCVISIPFEGMPFPPPYIAAAILLDGADIPLFHLVRGVSPDEARMGLRVRALWAEQRKPTLESIQWFEPTGEPDADYASYAEHL